MSTLSSTSTYAEVLAAYDNGASYAEDNSTSKAASFETACRILLRREPVQTGRAGSAIVLDKQSIREELQRVRSWLAARGGASASAQTSSSRHLSFEGFRS